MTFGNLIFNILTLRKTGTAGELNIWKNKGRVKEYCPDSKGLFKEIEPLFPRRPSSSLRAVGFTLYEVGLRGDEDGRWEEKPRTSREWPPKGIIFDP